MTMSFLFPPPSDFRGSLSKECEECEEALLEEVELEVQRLEPLLPNSLLLKTAQLVALRLKEVQLVEWRKWGLEALLNIWRLEDLLCKLRRVEILPLRRHYCYFYSIFEILCEMLWQKHLESLLFSSNISGFPNKHRPPCTTMPWNIRPALVVLWGVCWMFNPWSPIDDIQLQPLSAGGQTLFSSGKVFPHSNVHFVRLTFPRRY
jgi:hypothetical protein